MSYSPHDGYIKSPGSTTANGPVDAAMTRGVMLNNAIWACEQASQVRVKKIIARQADEMVRDTDRSLVADEWYPIFKTRFDCHLHPEDGAYRFRVRLAGRATVGSHTASFRLILSIPTFAASDVVIAPVVDHLREYSSASTSHGWLTPDNSGTNLIEVPRELVAAAVVGQRQLTAIAGVSTAVPTCKLSCQVWGAVSDTAADAAVSGVIVEEFIGT